MLSREMWIFLACFVLINHGIAPTSTEKFDINQYIENSIATFKLKIHQAAQRHEWKLRRRRSVEIFNSTYTRELLIASIEPFSELETRHAVELQPFKIGVDQYIAVVNYEGDMTPSKIYQFKNGNFTLVQQFAIFGCIDFEFADFNEEKFAIFVEHQGKGLNGKVSYERLYHVYRYVPPGLSATSFHHEFHVKMDGGTSVKAFLHKGRQYYVAANSIRGRGSRDVKSTVHVKTSFGILLIQEFETNGAEDVEVFVMDGRIYLAFASHKNADGSVDIYSKIYREKVSSDANQYISFEYVQRILTHGARDLEYFEMKNHHYVVVANEYSQLISYQTDMSTNSKKRVITNDYEIDSVIYWWSGRFFVEWQRIPTAGAFRWSSFNGPDGTKFLSVANSKSKPVIYVYDPQVGLFKPTKVQGLLPTLDGSQAPDVRSVKAFMFNGQAYLAVANYNQTGRNIFKLNYQYKESAESGFTVEQQLRKALKDLKTRMAQVKEMSKKIEGMLGKVMSIHGNQTSWGNFSFENVTINKLKVKGNIIYTNESKKNPIVNALKQAIKLKENLTLHEDAIKELQKRLNDSVMNGEFARIKGEKIFAGNVQFNDLKVEEMKVGKINEVNVTDLNLRAWSKSKPQIITGRYVFKDHVKMLQNLEVNGTVNEIRIPDDVMTTNTDQRVQGKKVFTKPVVLNGNMTTVNATINGLNIPDDLVLRNTRQRVTGQKNFSKAVIVEESIIVVGKTNGLDLSEFSKRVVTLSSNQTITRKKTFLKGFAVGQNLDVTGLVDGVNLTELDSDAVRINQSEVIKGDKTILGSVRVLQDVKTFSTTNGLLLQDNVMTTNTDQVINVSKTFNNIHVQGNIVTTSTVNGIDLSEEAVTKSGDQTIYGEKTFDAGVTVNGDVSVSGTVDGVNVSQFSNSVMRTDGENVVTAPQIFTGKVTVEYLSIKGTFNDANLTQLRDEIWTIDGNHTITAPMTFENLVVQSNLNVSETVNDAKIPDDYLVITKEQSIDDEVIFEDSTVFDNEVRFGPNSSLNGEHLPTFLKSAVLNGTDQTIRGVKTFKNDLSTDGAVFVGGNVNGYKVPDDFVTLSTDQNITGIKTFVNAITVNGSLYTDIIHINQTVNGIDISELQRKAVFKGGNQTISGTVVFTGHVSVLGPVTVEGLVDGVNITELAGSAVLLSQPQTIKGKKVFLKDLELHKPLTSPGLINDVNLTELERNSLKRNGPEQFVSGTKTFENTIYIGGNIINGTINSVNLEKLAGSVVTKGGRETINGDLTFLQSVSCNHLSLSGNIDNVSLDNVLLTSGDQIVGGNKVFDGGLSLRKSLTVDGLVNGVNVSELSQSTMRLEGDQNSTAQLFFHKGFHVNGSIELDGLVNGVDISQLDRDAVRINGTETIGGRKTFLKNVTVLGNVNIKETLNGINVTELLNDIVYKSRNQTITGKKTFTAENGIKVESDLTSKNVILKGLINGVNITELDATMVKLSTDQILYGHYTFVNSTVFDEDVNVKGLLNGVDLSSDVMLTSGDQRSTGVKEFKNMVVNGSIEIDGKVDGVDISEFAKSRVTLSTNQTIYGEKTFEADVTVAGDIDVSAGATVNGIDISEEVLLVDDDPLVVKGRKRFTQDMTISGDLKVTGWIAGLNVSEMDSKIVRTDDVKELRGKTTFVKNLTVIGNITCRGYVNGVKIEKIVAETEDMKKKTQHKLSALRAATYPVCRKIKVLLNVTGVEKRIDGMEKLNELAISQGGSIDSINIGNEVFLAVARPAYSGCGEAYILHCGADMTCSIKQLIKTRAINIQFFTDAGGYYVFIQHFGSQSSGCSSYPEILKYVRHNGKFETFYNVTSSLYERQRNLSMIDTVVQNIASLVASVPVSTPIGALGTMIKGLPALSRVFFRNGTTYWVQAMAWTGTYGIEVSTINRSTLVARVLQKITTSEVTAMDIGYIERRTMLIVAQRRAGREKDIVLFSLEEGRGFFFYQRIQVAAQSLRFINLFDRFYFVYANPDVGFGLCPWKGVMGFDQCISVPNKGIEYITQVTTSKGVYICGVQRSSLIVYESIVRGVAPKYNGTLNCSP